MGAYSCRFMGYSMVSGLAETRGGDADYPGAFGTQVGVVPGVRSARLWWGRYMGYCLDVTGIEWRIGHCSHVYRSYSVGGFGASVTHGAPINTSVHAAVYSLFSPWHRDCDDGNGWDNGLVYGVDLLRFRRQYGLLVNKITI